ncbi:MAG: vWA domain-containing protein [Planctomycetia bacterium]
MVAELVLFAVVVLAAAAERLHAGRAGRLATLTFGPTGRLSLAAAAAPLLRVAALGAVAWGLTTLLLLAPKAHRLDPVEGSQTRHLVLLLDVSPSMRLADAGPTKKQTRSERTSDLLKSFFARAPIALYKISTVAVYTGAKPVVEDTTDLEIIQNILNDLPMHYAFKAGPTDLFSGLSAVAELSRKWPPGSAALVVLSDGDTIPPAGMPKLPVSIGNRLVVGVGDPTVGTFIDGHQSRQDVSQLRQLAARIDGSYHNGNELQIPTRIVQRLTSHPTKSAWEQLNKRDYALAACFVGAATLMLLRPALRAFGTRWRPGRRDQTTATPAPAASYDRIQTKRPTFVGASTKEI